MSMVLNDGNRPKSGWTSLRSGMKKSCIGARSERGVAGLPRRVTCFCAALTLAMNMATSKMMRQVPGERAKPKQKKARGAEEFDGAKY